MPNVCSAERKRPFPRVFSELWTNRTTWGTPECFLLKQKCKSCESSWRGGELWYHNEYIFRFKVLQATFLKYPISFFYHLSAFPCMSLAWDVAAYTWKMLPSKCPWVYCYVIIGQHINNFGWVCKVQAEQAGADSPGMPFAPLCLHSGVTPSHLPGLWGCFNPHCSGIFPLSVKWSCVHLFI